MLSSSDIPITSAQPRKSFLNDETTARIAKVIEEFEQRRKARVSLFYGTCVLVAIAAVAAGLLTQGLTQGLPRGLLPQDLLEKAPGVAILIGIGGFWYAFDHAKLRLDRLRGEFKDKVLPIVLDEFGFGYDRKASRISLRRYKRILPDYEDNAVYTEDHFWGERDGIRLSLAEVHLTAYCRHSSRRYCPLFLCRIGEFDFPKRAAAAVYVMTDTGSLSRGFRSLFSSGDRIKLEHPVFEKQFDVYSTDQIAARYILTPTMMDRLVSMARQFRGVQAVFEGDTVRLTLPPMSDLFHPGCFLARISPHIANDFVRDMRTIFEFIDALKLDANTKV